MELNLKRIILFSPDVARLASFYEDVIGLPVVGRDRGWVEFNGGGCNIAIHNGRSKIGDRPPKLVFYSSDVTTTRSHLIERGLADVGAVKSVGSFDICDGHDTDGNAIQISSRA